jgi:hypothetical protein
MNGKMLGGKKNAGDEENGGDSLPFFLFPGQLVAPVAPARNVACEQDKGRRPSTRGRNAAPQGEGPDPRGPLPPKGRFVTQTDNANVARMLGQRVRLSHGERRARGCISNRSDGRGAMGDACVDTVRSSETVIARARRLLYRKRRDGAVHLPAAMSKVKGDNARDS